MQENIYDKIKKLETWLLQFKSSQKITSDSWVLYKYPVVIKDTDGGKYLVFKLNNDSNLATVQMFQELSGFEPWPVGLSSNISSIYFWECPMYMGTRTILITSSQPGTAYISTTPPV